MADSALLKQHVHRRYPTVHHGKGVFLYDTDGKRYLDGSAGPMTANIGHGVKEITRAIDEQLSRVAFTYRTQFTNEPAEALAKRLTRRAPGDLDWAFFVSSGSEATEFAMRAAIGYWREVGRPAKTKILSRHLSYHGMTLGSLSMSGHAARRPDYGTLLHAFPVGPPAYAYRYAHAGESAETYADRSVAEFEAAVRAENPETVAAVIVEPIVGAAGGVLVPPPGYLPRLRDMCDRLGVLLILDEVITGGGRTGDWFACISEDVVPDLLAVGKGLSAGYSPVGGVLLRQHLVVCLAFE
jgi:adenosylmethionine-8-amino-7-oxononanoate aminotransferase